MNRFVSLSPKFFPLVLGGFLSSVSLPCMAAETTASETATEVVTLSRLESFNAFLAAERDREKERSTSEYDWLIVPRAKAEEFNLLENNTLEIVFNEAMSQRSWNAESIDLLMTRIQDYLKANHPKWADYKLKLGIAYNLVEKYKVFPIEEWATTPELIQARIQGATEPVKPLAAPVVERVDYAGPAITNGLAGSNLVIAASHGWTWHQEQRWQFQRARVYTTVEDLFPLSSVNPFLIPMLENAGAMVWSARERSYQTAEVIVDNEHRDPDFQSTGNWEVSPFRGWSGGRVPAMNDRVEPFSLGDSLRAAVDAETTSTVRITPLIPRSGEYPVYASWGMSNSNSSSVPMTIHHAGGSTTVRVNQQVAGGTWVYLGSYPFQQGQNEGQGSVEITTAGAVANESGTTWISVDAFRFGGGMGNIAPGDHVSGKPRYAETALYNLQYSGAPRDFVFNAPSTPGHFGIDYNQDITARGEYPNWLQGSPNGPNAARNHPGLGVPVDAMVSWHTDAGGQSGGIVGTLMLYQIQDDRGEETFPDGRSRFLNRDLSTLIMEEYIRTIRGEFSSTWPRRDLREVGYGEIRRPNTPSTIIELLSHHNFQDMKYGVDPRFKKATARSVYKALTRFVCYGRGHIPVIQPLEPAAVSLRHRKNGLFALTIKPQLDPLEPTALPTHYIVYESRDGFAFDNGTQYPATGRDGETNIALQLPKGEPRYFRVTAANEGGQSLPSSVVGGSYYGTLGLNRVLLVDAFDRISGPEIVEAPGAQGFNRHADPGVGYHYNDGVVGDQYDFNFNSEWKNDLETPGRGASTSHLEDHREKGNSFDHIVAYGKILHEQKYPFDSSTRLLATANSSGESAAVIWIGGEQKTVLPFVIPEELKEGAPDRMESEFPLMESAQAEWLLQYLSQGGKVIISGAYVGEELMGPAADEAKRTLALELGVQSFIRSASTINALTSADDSTSTTLPARFGRDLESPINIVGTVYPVEHPQGFTTTTGKPLAIYGDTGEVAAFQTKNALVAGFPLETVLPLESRSGLILNSLENLLGKNEKN
ncbi:MAG: hypothetical protein SFY68_10315 [Candidatus Sumerlaeia bacterium]|nr:hypothetical protein [Candidatus Sumerlaeia bacterium]